MNPGARNELERFEIYPNYNNLELQVLFISTGTT